MVWHGRFRAISASVATAVFLACVWVAATGRPSPSQGNEWDLMRVLAAVIVVGVSLNLILQIGSLARAAQQGLRAADRRAVYAQIATAGLALLFGIAFAFWSLSAQPGACTNQTLDITDTFYFTMTVITSTGFGDIVPASKFCRNLVTIQMISTFLAITVGLSQLIAFSTAKSKVAEKSN